MIANYTTIHDWIMLMAERTGVVSVDELRSYPVPIDREHIVAAAWDLVDDDWLTYGADAKFRLVQNDRVWAPFDPFA